MARWWWPPLRAVPAVDRRYRNRSEPGQNRGRERRHRPGEPAPHLRPVLSNLVRRRDLGHQRFRAPHTINVVSVEDYLRGVVPNEVPASWASAALQSQAVAARSYVLAGDTRWVGYADTCDTTTCQVYDGRYTTRGAGLRTSTHPRTDEAIAATADLVRLTSDGKVARTEFSSSSGGHTAGGDFPAVVDAGDSISANRNANWQVSVDLQAIEDSYDLGPIRGVAVIERNGLGADGGPGRRGRVSVRRRHRHPHRRPGQAAVRPQVELVQLPVDDEGRGGGQLGRSGSDRPVRRPGIRAVAGGGRRARRRPPAGDGICSPNRDSA